MRKESLPELSQTSFNGMVYLMAHVISLNDTLYKYTFGVNVLKSASSSYVQNMIENVVLASYLDESYFVASI